MHTHAVRTNRKHQALADRGAVNGSDRFGELRAPATEQNKPPRQRTVGRMPAASRCNAECADSQTRRPNCRTVRATVEKHKRLSVRRALHWQRRQVDASGSAPLLGGLGRKQLWAIAEPPQRDKDSAAQRYRPCAQRTAYRGTHGELPHSDTAASRVPVVDANLALADAANTETLVRQNNVVRRGERDKNNRRQRRPDASFVKTVVTAGPEEDRERAKRVESPPGGDGEKNLETPADKATV